MRPAGALKKMSPGRYTGNTFIFYDGLRNPLQAIQASSSVKNDDLLVINKLFITLNLLGQTGQD